MIVLAATNRPQDLDEAIRRRLEKRIYIPLPNEIGRRALLDINLKGVKVADDVDLDLLVEKTPGYSGADLTNVCREAAMMPMRRKIMEGNIDLDDMDDVCQDELELPITMDDFLAALKNIQKSVS